MGERQLGPYRLERRLGKGGMGEVWEAHDATAGRRVALKILTEGERASVGRFLEEARLGATFAHPGLVRVLDSGVERDRPWLAMELLDGRTLSELRRARPEGWPLGLVGALGLQALDALEALHEAKGEDGTQRPVIHRDVKPSNLLLTRDGALKVIDFGVALAASSSDRTRTGSGFLVGSVRYTSPEQARGAPVTPRSDLFSLALVLHELLTGKRVYDQPTEVAVLSALIWQRVPRASSLRPELPAAVDDALAWALQADPAKRPKSAREFAEALRSAFGASLWPQTDLAGFVAKAEETLPKLPPEDARDGTVSLGPKRVAQERSEAALVFRPKRRWHLGGLAALLAVGLAVGRGFFISRGPMRPGSEAPLEREGAGAPGLGSPATGVPVVPSGALPTQAQPVVPGPSSVEVAPAQVVAAPTGPDSSAGVAHAHPAVRTPSTKSTRSRVNRHRAMKARPPGFLTVNVQPGWGKVLIDGHAVGETPLYRHSISAGVHQVEALRKDGVRRSRKISVTSERESKVVFTW